MADAPTPPSGGGGGAPAGPAFLRGKAFGMPRWVFAALIVGGVVVGLYLRNRSQAASDVTDTGAVADSSLTGDLGVTDPSMAGYDAFAGSGALPGPVNGSVLPVNAPTIPEGFPDVFASQGEVIAGLAGSLGDVVGASMNPPVVNVTVPRTGAGKKGAAAPKKKPKKVANKPSKKRKTASLTGGGAPSVGGNKAHAVIRQRGHAGPISAPAKKAPAKGRRR